MNWKAISIWTALFVGLSFFFFSFATFLFAQQEEMQLFIPEWSNLQSLLFRPGGLCHVAGLFCVQFYQNFVFASLFNSLLLTGIAYFTYQLLQQIARRGYNFLLFLFVVPFLFHFHTQWAYVVDGTIGLFFMLLLLYLSVFIDAKQITYGILSTIFIYLLAGQLTVLYALLYVIFNWIRYKKTSIWLCLIVLIAVALSYADVRYFLALPLTYGLYGESYHETELQPDSYMYYVWIRFSILLFLLLVISCLLGRIDWKGKVKRILIFSLMSVLLFLFTGACLPRMEDVQNRMGDQLAYWSRQHNWDAIIGMHYGKKIPFVLNRNYLNFALAQKGVLANRLFFFDQYGPQGLLAPYNRTYRMSLLLSDIHFLTGDISTSESYAMEALTLARRGGSPRALQRLVQINLLKGEWNLVEKYLSILSRMPNYRDWAVHYHSFMRRPDKIAAEPEFMGKQIGDYSSDKLLSQIDLTDLWTIHSDTAEIVNRTSLEYLGCSYLLAKKMNLFKALYLRIKDDPIWKPLPLHFQEAVLILSDEDPSLSNEGIDETVRRRYEAYKRASKQALQFSDGLSMLYQQYGNSFWFYYQYKNMKNK